MKQNYQINNQPLVLEALLKNYWSIVEQSYYKVFEKEIKAIKLEKTK
jgi:hypothetical protein